MHTTLELLMTVEVAEAALMVQLPQNGPIGYNYTMVAESVISDLSVILDRAREMDLPYGTVNLVERVITRLNGAIGICTRETVIRETVAAFALIRWDLGELVDSDINV